MTTAVSDYFEISVEKTEQYVRLTLLHNIHEWKHIIALEKDFIVFGVNDYSL
jgi:hypothetical protein